MQFDSVTCTHCGLLCDDLEVETNDLFVQLNPEMPAKCKHHFEDASLEDNKAPSPFVKGATATQKDALQKACEILASAKQPLISGLIGDVQTCRNAIALAEKIGGVIDHANGARLRTNNAVMQRHGEVKTTLAEIRNRADCVVIIGSGILENFPRLYKRILSPAQSLNGDTSTKKNIFVLDVANDADKSIQSMYEDITFLNFDEPTLESIIQKLHGIIASPNKISNKNTYAIQALLQLCEIITNSQYTTFLWSPGEFNQATAEQTIQTLTQLIKRLMVKNRVVGLTLGGSKAEITANQIATWQMGIPLPIAFMNGAPNHNPNLFDGMAMLQNNEADALLWIATYNSSDLPPETSVPTIVIGHPNMKCNSDVQVYIPTGVPGIDHRGLACRTDNVATLPLKAIRASDLPAANEVIKQLTENL